MHLAPGATVTRRTRWLRLAVRTVGLAAETDMEVPVMA
jgi:hypothetical protein